MHPSRHLVGVRAVHVFSGHDYFVDLGEACVAHFEAKLLLVEVVEPVLGRIEKSCGCM